eukprot:scaffold8907_cov105-Isochrysis_galbana.AAC.7
MDTLFSNEASIDRRLLATSPALPLIPNSGRGACLPPRPRRANCACASHTSSRSRHRCMKASTCAKMLALSIPSHDRPPALSLSASMAALVVANTLRQASPAAMLCSSVTVDASTSPSKISRVEIAPRHRAMTSLDTLRSSPVSRSSVL